MFDVYFSKHLLFEKYVKTIFQTYYIVSVINNNKHSHEKHQDKDILYVKKVPYLKSKNGKIVKSGVSVCLSIRLK